MLVSCFTLCFVEQQCEGHQCKWETLPLPSASPLQFYRESYPATGPRVSCRTQGLHSSPSPCSYFLLAYICKKADSLLDPDKRGFIIKHSLLTFSLCICFIFFSLQRCDEYLNYQWYGAFQSASASRVVEEEMNGDGTQMLPGTSMEVSPCSSLYDLH